ncbi:MAG: hypothetical protein ACK41O_16550 [Runella zeae]
MKTQGENQQEFSERQEESWRKRLKEFLEFSGEVPAKGGRLERILQDKAAVDVSELVDLLDWYRELNPTWLLTGKGWMIRSGHGNDILPGAASEGGLVEQMRKMIKEELKKAPPTIIKIEKFAGKLDVSIPGKEEMRDFESMLTEALSKLLSNLSV